MSMWLGLIMVAYSISRKSIGVDIPRRCVFPIFRYQLRVSQSTIPTRIFPLTRMFLHRPSRRAWVVLKSRSLRVSELIRWPPKTGLGTSWLPLVRKSLKSWRGSKWSQSMHASWNAFVIQLRAIHTVSTKGQSTRHPSPGYSLPNSSRSHAFRLVRLTGLVFAKLAKLVNRARRDKWQRKLTPFT